MEECLPNRTRPWVQSMGVRTQTRTHKHTHARAHTRGGEGREGEKEKNGEPQTGFTFAKDIRDKELLSKT